DHVGRGRGREGPLSVGRQRARTAFAQSHGRGPVRLAFVDRSLGPASLSGFGEEQGLTVGGQVHRDRAVQPRQISFLRISWKASEDLMLFHASFQQHPAVARDVLENEVSWKRHESAGAARESDRTESGCASLELAVPELVTSR